MSCKVTSQPIDVNEKISSSSIVPGAYRLDAYLPLLRNKSIALVVNHTSTIHQTHLVDSLLALKLNVKMIFAPEHGFKGSADAGEAISNGMYLGKIPIVSLYGAKKKPADEDLRGIEMVVFDIQDVGARFYTFLSTLHYIIEACANNDIPLVVLDRPNPNIRKIDGPVLKPDFASFVGLHPVPVAYGMSIGEYAQMISTEKWVKTIKTCNLQVISCLNYTRTSKFELTIAPSPNLPNQTAILLYPSMCFIEGTAISEGRGTEKQFQVYGHPEWAKTNFSFVPISRDGAKNPKLENKTCNGIDLSQLKIAELEESDKIDLSFILDAYARSATFKERFFLKGNFFDKLAGSDELRNQILGGWTEQEIRESWVADLKAFKAIRSKYLLY